MTSRSRKITVLLWKCVVLRKRNWILSIFELISPILVVCLLRFTNIETTDVNSETKHKENMNFGYFRSNQSSVYKANTSLTHFYNSPVNMTKSTYIAYTPKTVVVDKLMRSYRTSVTISDPNIILRMESKISEAELESTLRRNLLPNSSYSCVLGVVFSDPAKIFKYKIIGNFDDSLERTHNPYSSAMFLKLQEYLDAHFLKSVDVKYEDTKVLIGEFLQNKNISKTEYEKNKIISEVKMVMLYIFLTLAYSFLVTAVVRDTIQEKSSGIKELMRIMGVSSWMIWIHWFIYSMLIQIPVTVVVTVLLTVISPPVFDINIFIVWFLFFLVTVDYIIIFFLVTCFFEKPTKGNVLCNLGWTIINLALVAVIFPRDQGSYPVQVLISLSPLMNLCWSLQSLDSFNWKQIDWNLSYLFTKGFTGSYISVGEAIIIFICEIIVFSFLLAYVDAVKPGRYGVAKPVTFIFSSCVKLLQKNKETVHSEASLLSTGFEPPLPGSKVGIRIRELHKEFGVFKKVVAVENVNLDIYEREVTVLLGHNGAGKTTTMSMISGMFSPTSGTVLVDDKNIYDNLFEFRQSLGLCPQHNLYFPKLTVIEHLMFFGMLKGRSRSQAKGEAMYLLHLLNLTDKKNFKGSELSGGMLRRLCLAVALTGGPKVLILDEPTSGLDPENRRHIWDIILSLRGERTILITTHYMEEADVLGDRIAIMDHGKVVCCGTTMFLKKLYGTGYNIHITKIPNASVVDITQIVQRYVPKFETKVKSPAQVDYTIKDEFVQRFPDLFSTFESSMNSLGVTGISVSCTTMEDVFLRVAELSEEQLDHSPGESKPVRAEQGDYYEVEGCTLVLQRIEALVMKRALYMSKHLISTLIIFIIACLLILSLTLLTDKYKPEDNGEMEYTGQTKIDLSLYPDSIFPIVYDEPNTKTAEIAHNIIKSTRGQSIMMKLGNTSQFESIYEPMDQFLSQIADNASALNKVVLGSTFIKNDFLIQYQPVLNPYASSNAANLMANILLKRIHPDRSIEIISHSLNAKRKECSSSTFGLIVFFVVFFVPCALTVVMADFIRLTAEEKVTGFKYQQIIAGVSPILYRIISFLCDFCLYILFIIVSLVIILIFGSNVMPLSSDNMLMFILVLILFGVSSIVFLHVFSYLSDNSAMIIGLYFTFNFTFMLTCPILLLILHRKSLKVQIFSTVIMSLHPSAAAFFAIYSIGNGIANDICSLSAGLELYEYLGFPSESNRNSILLYVAFLILDTILYSIILCFIDHEIYARIKYVRSGIYDCQGGDNDVKYETQRVRMFKEAKVETIPLRAEGLVKNYRALRAANQVSFLVTTGECFGLLGVNGAGKTTTFKMLTGEIFPSSGDAFSTKYSVVSERQKYLSNIGYCPQFDALLDDLTGNNILTIIAKIRGVPRREVSNQVHLWLRILGIEEHANKRTKTYSGGTKRKLGTAMAFIGEPIVALLDEPTTGVDPAARRKVWSAVKERQSCGYSAVLTSHSMEECEALCSRITIMRRGELCCIGSLQELKTKYGQGYTVLLKLALTQDFLTELEALKREFLKSFPKSIIQDENINMITYRVLDGRTPLSSLFSVALHLKKKYKTVEDFIISNATLEQLFLLIARGQDIRTSHPGPLQ